MTEAVSEHRQRLRLATLAPALLLGMMALFSVFACIFFAYVVVSGRGSPQPPWWILLPLIAMTLLVGYATWRLVSRVFCIRRIRLLEPATIELLTWGGSVLRAHLPETIERVVIVGVDLTLHLKVGRRRLIILTEDFSDSATMKSWLEASGLRFR